LRYDDALGTAMPGPMKDKTDQRSDGKMWVEHEGVGPLFGTAIHSGHEIRRELLPLLTIDESARAREEDPYTDSWVKIVPSWIAVKRSRFEVDLNRPPEEAVYFAPEMAWGLHVWEHPLDKAEIEESLQEYNAFYRELHRLLGNIAARHQHFVVLDLHSYNYRRPGPYEPPENPEENPDVNVGTGSLDRELFGAIVERFIADLRSYDFPGRHLDVRENVKFKGRRLAQWIHQNFPGSACVLSIEFKKFFMNEWTGVGDLDQIEAVRGALQSTLPGLLEELRAMDQ
jgi:N-formylglutamate deformylase